MAADTQAEVSARPDVQENSRETGPTPAKLPWRGAATPWYLANGILTLVLTMQVVHLFRVEFAAAIPASRSFLESYCERMGCTISYPRNAALLSIESSDLLPDEHGLGIMTLHALVRNYASYPQALPSFELTLTDAGERPLARHVFDPASYLRGDVHPPGSIAPGSDLEVKLRFEESHPETDGYRIFLFYPEQQASRSHTASYSLPSGDSARHPARPSYLG